ncbi:putative aldose 1-epimerase [Helianthus debilis subsp. tardiflorus]
MPISMMYKSPTVFYTMMMMIIITSFVLLCGSGAGGVSASKHEDNIGIYELNNGHFSVKLTNWGATIISLLLPDKNGKFADVVLGYDSVRTYKNDSTYFGAIVGRVANRIGGARFILNGTRYELDANEQQNMLHGGHPGFSDVVWEVTKYKRYGESPRTMFTYHSFDGEEGFPRDLKVMVTYSLVGKFKLSVKMVAESQNKATPVNLAQHTYWNLGGHDSGDILSEKIQIFGSHITPTNDQLIPTGRIVSVKGTPYDLLEPRVIKSKIKELTKGFDINYVLDGEKGKKMKRVAVVWDEKSGRSMRLTTDAPGVQFYTGNNIEDVKGKGGYVYEAHAGLCLETQGFPDSVNHPNFPSQIVNPGQVYKHHMLFMFSIHQESK